jgi:hypothetical protein
MSFLHSSRYCIQLEGDKKVKISYGGSPPKDGCLRLDPSVVP